MKLELLVIVMLAVLAFCSGTAANYRLGEPPNTEPTTGHALANLFGANDIEAG